MPGEKGSKTVRLGPHSYARLMRIREELNRRAREGKGFGGVAGPEFSIAAVHRALLQMGFEHYEKLFHLPKLKEAEQDDDD